MKVTRIMNGGRIAPASPKSCTDSERSSWSSASRVSTPYTRSPEPKIEESDTQKLDETVPKSSSLSAPKKFAIGVGIACVLLFIIVGVLAGVLSHKGSEPASEPNVTTSSTTTSGSSSTTEPTSSITNINGTKSTVK